MRKPLQGEDVADQVEMVDLDVAQEIQQVLHARVACAEVQIRDEHASKLESPH